MMSWSIVSTYLWVLRDLASVVSEKRKTLGSPLGVPALAPSLGLPQALATSAMRVSANAILLSLAMASVLVWARVRAV